MYLKSDINISKKGKKQKRHLNALYDSMFNILLKGYVEIMRQKIIPATGQMIQFLFELTMELDEYLDKNRNTDHPLSREEVRENPRIKEQLSIFHNYIKLFGREEPISSYLKDMFSVHYNHYIKLIKTDVGRESFNNTLEISQIDSGQSLSSTMEIVRMFNMHQPNQSMLNEFYILGTVGKFAEDIIDLARDIQKGHLNLFFSLVKKYPDEMENLCKEVKQHKRIDFKWLNKNCHRTFIEYTNIMDDYYSQLTFPGLKFICDLATVPVFLGDYDPERHAAS